MEMDEEYNPPKPGEFLIVGSISGGKDSTAMALWLKEQGHDCRWVFADTGWEDPQTYDYLRNELPKTIGPIDWVRKEIKLEGDAEQLAQDFERRIGGYSAMIRACVKKRIFPSRVVRWCTSDLKVGPLKKYMLALDDAIVNGVGIRAEESLARSKMPVLEYSAQFKCDVWRPILRWTVQDVIDIHHRHGIKPNPKYLQGAERVGCWPCIHARKSEIRMFSKDTERMNLLRDLEAALTKIQDEHREAAGLHKIPVNAWFQAKSGHVIDESGERRRDGTRWPIDKVAEWANTSRGGRQFEMFAAFGEEAGCVRWGLCDTGLEGEE
jgi:3'-phosphoadenosine 5'-phosphosulfate sulfotransferase (PAPS reductase)/FAD synthetase